MTMKLLSADLASALLLPTAALTAGAATQIDEVTIEVHMPDIYTSYAPAELVSVPDGADYTITYAAYYDDRAASTDALRFTAAHRRRSRWRTTAASRKANTAAISTIHRNSP